MSEQVWVRATRKSNGTIEFDTSNGSIHSFGDGILAAEVVSGSRELVTYRLGREAAVSSAVRMVEDSPLMDGQKDWLVKELMKL